MKDNKHLFNLSMIYFYRLIFDNINTQRFSRVFFSAPEYILF